MKVLSKLAFIKNAFYLQELVYKGFSLVKCTGAPTKRVTAERSAKRRTDCGAAANFSEAAHPPGPPPTPPSWPGPPLRPAGGGRRQSQARGRDPGPRLPGTSAPNPCRAPAPRNRPERGTARRGEPGASAPPPRWPEGGRGSGTCKDTMSEAR